MKWPALTTDECMEIFKRYDMTTYEYYHNNMWYFGCNAVNYDCHLKEKHEKGSNHDGSKRKEEVSSRCECIN